MFLIWWYYHYFTNFINFRYMFRNTVSNKFIKSYEFVTTKPSKKSSRSKDNSNYYNVPDTKSFHLKLTSRKNWIQSKTNIDKCLFVIQCLWPGANRCLITSQICCLILSMNRIGLSGYKIWKAEGGLTFIDFSSLQNANYFIRHRIEWLREC